MSTLGHVIVVAVVLLYVFLSLFVYYKIRKWVKADDSRVPQSELNKREIERLDNKIWAMENPAKLEVGNKYSILYQGYYYVGYNIVVHDVQVISESLGSQNREYKVFNIDRNVTEMISEKYIFDYENIIS